MIYLLTNVKNEVSQPNRCRILCSPKRIEQTLLVLSWINGRRNRGQREWSCQRFCQSLGNECDKVRLRYRLKGLQITGNTQHNIPRHPFLPEPAVDWVFHLPPADNGDVVRI